MTVCEVTSAQVSYNPRLVKEADALAGAGYDVHVVAPVLEDAKTGLDRELVSKRAWQWHPVPARRGAGFGETLRWLAASFRQAVYRRVAGLRGSDWGAARAYSRYVDELAERAAALSADLYIAHNLQALPAAWKAARSTGARLGFDAEDFHRGEFHLDHPESLEKRLTERIEETFIARSDYVTAASPGIGDAYAGLLDMEPPTTVLNVFSLEERDADLPAAAREAERPPGDDVVSVYWYSQVIGPDRGLQDAVRAIGRLDDRFHLSLRGTWADGFRDEVTRIAEAAGATGRVHHLSPAPPDELVARAGLHDIGIAVEPSKDPNNDIAISNKILVYLLAGLAVAATETSGQRFVHDHLCDAVRLCGSGSPEELSEQLSALAGDPDALSAAQSRAEAAGRERLNWEAEQTAFLDVVSTVLDTDA